MVEPIPTKSALKMDASDKSLPREEERNDSLMEPLDQNKALIEDLSQPSLKE